MTVARRMRTGIRHFNGRTAHEEGQRRFLAGAAGSGRGQRRAATALVSV
jgi:hypothetical protein